MKPTYYECRECGHMHPAAAPSPWHTKLTIDKLDALHGFGEWDEIAQADLVFWRSRMLAEVSP